MTETPLVDRDSFPATAPDAATAVLELDLDVIAANWQELRRRHPGGDVAGVVKADAYGLGAAAVAPRLYAAGCRHFFTAHLAEAIALRPRLPGALIAPLNGPVPGTEHAYLAHDIVPVLGGLGEIERWTALARAEGRKLPVLLHVDTGMNRLGLDAAGLAALADAPERLAGLSIRYVMTHLVAAELPDDPANAEQRRRFAAACAVLPPAPRSFANSSGIFLGAGFASDLARPGAALYGINPTPGRPNPMRVPLRLRARVLQVRDIAAGESVGYNATWRAPRPSRIATLGIGYADGWPRPASGRTRALLTGGGFDGTPVPLVGRVSMDLTTCDVTDAPPVVPGDWLELMGPTITPDDIADAAGTNAYEILTGLGPRIARIVPA
ncbi:alanine racemase [Rhodovastum atsumiense]|uniref:alanine racemase n=1 Tax=Rhodovastum atsumiense TaxID=504468 RepID=UPI001EEFC931|nr:alanine racemase [Rhodovastum atsumiense]